MDQFKTRETLFGQKELTEYPKLEELSVQFAPFYDLIDTASQVRTQVVAEYVKNPLFNIDYDQMEQNIQGWHTKCFQLGKSLFEDHEEASQVAMEVRKTIEEFMVNMPLIKCITLPALQDEDWRLIKETVGNDTMERE